MAALAPYPEHVDWRAGGTDGPLPFPIWSNETGVDDGELAFESFITRTDDAAKRRHEFDLFLATVPMLKPTTKRVYVAGLIEGPGDARRVMDLIPSHVEEVIFASCWNDIGSLEINLADKESWKVVPRARTSRRCIAGL